MTPANFYDLEQNVPRLTGYGNKLAKTLKPERTPPVILLAEDEPIGRYVAAAILRSAKYLVLPACHGREALDLSDQYTGWIDLLLTDIRMPFMDGFELAEG